MSKIGAICVINEGRSAGVRKKGSRVLQMPSRQNTGPMPSRETELLVMLFKCVDQVRKLDASRARLDRCIGDLCSELESSPCSHKVGD